MREKIIAGNIYHVVNRGVDKRKIFLDDEDHLRFIHDLFEFNDKDQVFNEWRLFKSENIISKGQLFDVRRRTVKTRKCLVEILIFCLMPNHYHLLLRAKSDSGIAEFMKKVNGGYAKYFNQKYERVGALFQGRYKSVIIKNEAHFIHLPYYIHLNPLDLKFPEWRKREVKDYKKTMEFLENYRWSSFQDYIGKKNFPSVTQRDFLLKFFGEPEQYKKDTTVWIKTLNLDEINHLMLEK